MTLLTNRELIVNQSPVDSAMSSVHFNRIDIVYPAQFHSLTAGQIVHGLLREVETLGGGIDDEDVNAFSIVGPSQLKA